jgi:hypothetical protein
MTAKFLGSQHAPVEDIAAVLDDAGVLSLAASISKSLAKVAVQKP